MRYEARVAAAAEIYISRTPVHARDNGGNQLWTREQIARAFLAGNAAVISEDNQPDQPSPGITITGETVRGERSHLPPPPISQVMGSEALVAWRVRHKNDGPHMWEYYLLPREKMLSNDLIYQDLNLRQLLDFLNDDRHANAQERAPEPHAPSYLLEAFRDAWKMANEAGVEDDWEDAFRFWAPPYAVTPYNHAPPVLPKGVYTAPTTQMTSPPPPRK